MAVVRESHYPTHAPCPFTQGFISKHKNTPREAHVGVFVVLPDPVDHRLRYWDHCLQAVGVHCVFYQTSRDLERDGLNPEVPDPSDSHVYHSFPHQLCHHYDSEHHI